ncbi:hypothetical protein ACHAXR_001772 [Thalassiosira sp. AJA248-18]
MPTSIVTQTAPGVIANEEWLETPKIGECRSMKMRMQPKEPKKVSMERMSAQDLKSIKKQDLFMYYSIPEVRRAEMLLEGIDASKDLATCELTRNCISSPSSLITLQGKALTHTVTRSSCISFECHPDILLFDLDDLSDEDFHNLNDNSDDCSYASSDTCSDDSSDGLILGWP